MKETYKTLKIKGNKTRYKISNYGNIYSTFTNKKLSKVMDKDGYEIVCLSINKKIKNYKVHRLVCDTFKLFRPLGKTQVNHIDGVKNNNTTSNLEWCNASENQIHACKMNLVTHRLGKENNFTKYTDDQIHDICKYISYGYTNNEINDILKIPKKYIAKIRRKERRTYISDLYF